MSGNRSLLSGVIFCCAVALTGCGMGTITTSGGGGTLSLQGMVHGGQQGVSGATIQLYTVGGTGNGSNASPMLTQTVLTDSTGSFTITKDYTCGQNSTGSTINSSNQVYLVSSGGNPGQAPGTDNKALVMVAALGPCGSLSATTYVFVNELTTVAAAWALAPFATSATNIGASGTNTVGISNAFVDAGLLVNTTTGMTATLPSNLSIESGKLAALADVLASCANSDGTSACSPLFAAATEGGSVPTDTFTAALNIVKNPGQKVTDVYAAIGTFIPFANTLIQAPNDWTMSLTVTGGGIVAPQALALDKEGNVWVPNHSGPLSAFNAQGTPLSATGFGASNATEIAQENGIAIDTSDNIWLTNQNGYGGSAKGTGNIVEFYGASSGQIGTSPQPMGYTTGIYFPDAIAADTNGDVFVANTGIATVTIYNSTGTAVAPYMSGGISLLLNPEALAVDANHGFWLPGSTNVVHISAPSTAYPYGQVESTSNCCQLSKGLATDATGHVWVADYLGGTSPNFNGAYAELAPDGTVLLSEAISGGISGPELVAVDAAQNAWFSNFTGASITEVAGTAGTVTPGTALSPTTGVYGPGGLGLDASLAGPFSIVPDRSGNLWICNQGLDTVTMFFGLAAPTATPIQPVPTAP